MTVVNCRASGAAWAWGHGSRPSLVTPVAVLLAAPPARRIIGLWLPPFPRRSSRFAPSTPQSRPGGPMTDTHGTPSPDLKIIETRVYRGPNMWSYDPAIHLVVDLGSLENFSFITDPGSTEKLLEYLPRLDQHHCSRGRKGGFIERLHEGTWLGHITEHVSLQLQQE